MSDLIYAHSLMQQLITHFSFPNTHALSGSEIRHKAHVIFSNFFKFASVINLWALVEKNVNPVSSSVVHREVYNNKIKNMIAKIFEKDIDYFKFTF